VSAGLSEALAALLDCARETTGFAAEAVQAASLQRFLAARLAAGCAPTEVAAAARRRDEDLVRGLSEAVAVGETYFFRHPEQFRALRRLLLASADPGRNLRLWSAGCGSGEEAWGLAALLAAAGRERGRDRILATDLSDRALDHARDGAYGRWSLRGVDPELERLLPGAAGRVEMPAELRPTVEWLRHDVRTPPPASGFDAVLFRNVTPFLAPGDAVAAVRRLFDAVRPGGYLVVAPAEAPLAAALEAERVEAEGASLFRRPWARAGDPDAARPRPSPAGPNGRDPGGARSEPPRGGPAPAPGGRPPAPSPRRSGRR